MQHDGHQDATWLLNTAQCSLYFAILAAALAIPQKPLVSEIQGMNWRVRFGPMYVLL